MLGINALGFRGGHEIDVLVINFDSENLVSIVVFDVELKACFKVVVTFCDII